MSILFLIPSLLDRENTDVIPQETRDIIRNIHVFFVENIKTSRRFLRKMIPDFDIDASTFYHINEHENEYLQAEKHFHSGENIGLLSECGYPAVADPGKSLIAFAHQCNIPVKPLTGPNSILMALMASGFNGQEFCFHGYLPQKETELKRKIQELLTASHKATQIFMEAPYRNDKLLKQLLLNLPDSTQLCIASNITGSMEKIISKPIAEWKKINISFHKQPAIFLLQSGN